MIVATFLHQFEFTHINSIVKYSRVSLTRVQSCHINTIILLVAREYKIKIKPPSFKPKLPIEKEKGG